MCAVCPAQPSGYKAEDVRTSIRSALLASASRCATRTQGSAHTSARLRPRCPHPAGPPRLTRPRPGSDVRAFPRAAAERKKRRAGRGAARDAGTAPPPPGKRWAAARPCAAPLRARSRAGPSWAVPVSLSRWGPGSLWVAGLRPGPPGTARQRGALRSACSSRSSVVPIIFLLFPFLPSPGCGRHCELYRSLSSASSSVCFLFWLLVPKRSHWPAFITSKPFKLQPGLRSAQLTASERERPQWGWRIGRWGTCPSAQPALCGALSQPGRCWQAEPDRCSGTDGAWYGCTGLEKGLPNGSSVLSLLVTLFCFALAVGKLSLKHCCALAAPCVGVWGVRGEALGFPACSPGSPSRQPGAGGWAWQDS